MPPSVMHDTRTIADLALKRWGDLSKDPYWKNVLQQSRALLPHSFCFWELHPCGKRIDVSVCEDLRNARARTRLQRWLHAQTFTHAAQQNAADILQGWLPEHRAFPAVFWEQDLPTGNVGIFVSVDRSTSFEHAAQAAATHFGLPAEITRGLASLQADLQNVLRPVAIGQFYGRDAPPELRMILRPTTTDWRRNLPQDIRNEVKELTIGLSQNTDINLALSLQPDRIASALEARYTADAVPNAAWKPWLNAVLPQRTPLHDEILAHLYQEPLVRVESDWPPHILLDAFVAPKNQVPRLRCSISHVKLQRNATGDLQRKLYLRADTLWTQLGSSAR